MFFSSSRIKPLCGANWTAEYAEPFKIKDTYDSNSDFDSLSESIQAGYYLKRGLSGSEEFYYMSILVTITGHSEQEVEWRQMEDKAVKLSGHWHR